MDTSKQNLVSRKCIEIFEREQIIWSILIYILMIGWGMKSTYITLISILIGTVLFIFTKCEKKFYILLFLLPYIAFVRPINLNISFYKLWTIIYLVNTFYCNPKLKISKIILMLIIIISVTMKCSHSGFIDYISFILSILVVFFTIIAQYNRNKFKVDFFKASIYLALSFIHSSILGYLLRIFWPGQIDYFKDVSAISGKISLKLLRFSGTMKDPNFFAQGLLISISCLMVCYLFLLKEKNSKSKRNLILIMIFTISLIGMQTYSKMYIIALSIIVVLFNTIILCKSNKFFIKVLVTLTIIIFSFVILKSDFINILIDRLKTNGGITTGRIDIVKNALSLVYESPYILINGVGVGNSISNFVGMELHNIYIEYILSIGFLGVIPWIILLISSVYKNIKFNYSYKFIPLITIAITGISLHGVSSDWHYYYLVLSILSINQISEYHNRKECI